jgi:hypothetical protein
MSDGFGDAFDQVFESDEATDAVKFPDGASGKLGGWGERTADEVSDALLRGTNPVQAELEVAEDISKEASLLSGDDNLGYAGKGFERLHDENPADIWESIDPGDSAPSLEHALDEGGTTAISDVQIGTGMIQSLTPAGSLTPAAELSHDAYEEVQRDPYLNPEVSAQHALVASPGDTGASYTPVDDASYEPSSYDMSSYDPSSDASGYDGGSAFGTVTDDSASSFTDGF